MSVFVLWEDRAIGTIDKFGPHVFLVACAAHQLRVDRHGLAQSGAINGKACAGNGSVLKELKRDPLWHAAAHVIAVLDTDKLHELLPGIPSRTTVGDAAYSQWTDAIAIEIRRLLPDHGKPRLRVCLLDRNLESLLVMFGRGASGVDAAIGKDRLARDKVLQRAAADVGIVTAACVGMPSWGALVRTVAELVGPGV